MSLNPFREALGQAGLRAFEQQMTFKPEADAALAQFHAAREDLERQVRRGDLTLKVAREKAMAAAEQMRAEVRQKAGAFHAAPRVLLDRLMEASAARKRSREHMSLEGLQRETNRLLRQSIIEQQVTTRAGEFESKTFLRRLPGGRPAPTLESLLAFHQNAGDAGDEAASEWAHRQLEGFRPQVTDPADVRRIDLACDRPDVVNPRLVAGYLGALQDAELDAVELFVTQAIQSGDANACVAAFLRARSEPTGLAVRWVRGLLSNLAAFPDSALATLRTLEAEARSYDAEAARAQADYAAAVAEASARLVGVEIPTDDELTRAERVRSRPVARLGEPIGLALERRGKCEDELLFEEEEGSVVT